MISKNLNQIKKISKKKMKIECKNVKIRKQLKERKLEN